MRFSCLKFVRVLTWRIRNWNKHRRCCLSWRSSFSQVPGIQQELQSYGEMPLNTCMRRMCNILIVEASSTTRNGSGTTFCNLWMKAIAFLLEEKAWKRAVLSTFLCSWWFFASFTSPDSCLSLLFFNLWCNDSRKIFAKLYGWEWACVGMITFWDSNMIKQPAGSKY